jgi:hypothetical protein
MSQGIKYVIVLVGIVAAFSSIIFGAYMPTTKAQLYVSSVTALPNIHSVQDFEDLFNRGFNFYSPIGDEETAKFLGTETMDVINGQTDQPEAVSRALIQYVEPHLMQYPNPRHLVVVANMHSVLWQRFKHVEDFKIAESSYKQALEMGPKLPPPLYGLLQLYLNGGDKADAKVIAERILASWPDDTRVQQVMPLLGK